MIIIIGTMSNIGDWGHEYIRQLENEIVETWNDEKMANVLMPLIKDIMDFNCHHHAEIQGCDLLMEIDQLNLLPQYITEETYERMCLYLTSCTKYVDVLEANKIMNLVAEQYMKFDIYSRALIIALQSCNKELVKNIFKSCKDK